MANEPIRPSWRDDSAIRKSKVKRAWQQEGKEPIAPPPKIPRGVKFWVLALSFLSLLGGLIYVIFWIFPWKPPALIFVYAGYETNLAIPHNLHGRNVQGAFQDWKNAGSDSKLPKLVYEEKLEKEKPEGEWTKKLMDCQEKTILLYFALHGGVDKEGNPYLFPDDAKPTDGPNQRLYISTILDKLAEEGLREKQKVLILDPTQVNANVAFGMLNNDFVRALKNCAGRIAGISKLVVICSSDEDQQSWPSDVVKKTIFGHFLLEGLKGAAKEGPFPKKVTALDLYLDLGKKVPNWVRDNRYTVQKPILLPRENGQEIAKEIILAHIDKPDKNSTGDAEPQKFWDLPEYKNIWQKYQDLSQQKPYPATFYPIQWKKYQDYIVRYEQLLRAGFKETDKIKGEINKSARELKELIYPDFNCLKNSIPLHSVFDLNFSPETATEKKGKWENIIKAGEILDDIARSDTGLLHKRAEELRKLFPPDNRPAEAHYLVMLDHFYTHFYASKKREVPSSPKFQECLKLAMSTRLLAERAALGVPHDKPMDSEWFYCYSERVFPWFQKVMEQADEQRRWGEDKLFSARESDWLGEKEWEGAKQHLEKARDSYKLILEKAEVIARAFQTRDEVLAMLPYYSQWMLARFLSEENKKEINNQISKIQGLWENVYLLEEQLENQDFEKTKKLAGEVKKVFEELKKDFQTHCRDSLGTQKIQKTWHDYHAVLSVPIEINVKSRNDLHQSFAKIDEDLFNQSKIEIHKDLQAPMPMALENGQNQGWIALAFLGEKRSRTAQKGYFLERLETGRREEIQQVGHEIASRWRQIPEEIRQATKKNGNEKIDLETILVHLKQADLLCRHCNTWQLEEIRDDFPKQCRQFLVCRLLLGLAHRVLADQWFDENGEAYFKFAGDKFEKDARKLLEDWKEPANILQDVQNLKKELLKDNPRLEISGEPKRQITTERDYTLKYQVKGKDLQKGFALFELQPSPELSKLVQKTAAETQIKFLPLDEDADLPFSFGTAPKEYPPKAEERSVLAGWYRGLKPEHKTTVELYYRPDIIAAQTPKPPYSGLAVRLHPSVEQDFDPSKGVISIILDCSGSMWQQQDSGGWEKIDAGNLAELKRIWKGLEEKNARDYQTKHRPLNRRFDKALNSLEKVLEELPEGVTINIRTFGQAEFEFNGEKIKNGEITQLIKGLVWNKGQLKNLMDKLRDLVPYHETPLVHAMDEAQQEDFPKGLQGFKTMVVLTDGEDNGWNYDPWYKRNGIKTNKDIYDFLQRTFQNSEIKVHMILFDVPENEKKGAKDQFSVIDEKFKQPSKLYITPDEKQLKENLKKAMNPEVRYWLRHQGRGIGSKEGLQLFTDELYHWYQPPQKGSYEIKVYGDHPQNIELYDGDFLLLDFKKINDQFIFDRVIFADEMKKGHKYRTTKTQGNRLFGLLQNQKVDESLELMVSLEDKEPRDPKRDYLVISRPRFVWFELKSDNQLIPFHWKNQEYFPVPAWTLGVRNWSNLVSNPKPTLSVWWTDDQDPLRSSWAIQTITRKPDQTENQNQKVAGLDQGPLFRVVSFEVFNNKPCMIVRLKFPKDDPIIVLPQEPNRFIEQEHQLYLEANQYTGIFYNVSVPDWEGKELKLQVISLERFKKEAQSQEKYILDFSLGTPARENSPPEEIKNLRKINN